MACILALIHEFYKPHTQINSCQEALEIDRPPGGVLERFKDSVLVSNFHFFLHFSSYQRVFNKAPTPSLIGLIFGDDRN